MAVDDSCNMDKIQVIIAENKSDITFPIIIRQLLIIRGFDNYQSISRMTDEDITDLEIFAKNTLSKIMAKKSREERVEMYGIFADDMELYDISKAHKRQIQDLIEICKKTKLKRKTEENCTRCKCINSSSNPKKLKPANSSTVSIEENEFEDHENNEVNNPETSTKSAERSLRNSSEHLINTTKSYVEKLSASSPFKINCDVTKITVAIEENFNFAIITCPVCDSGVRVTSAKSPYGTKWVLSNFNRHLKTHWKKSEGEKDKEPKTRPGLQHKKKDSKKDMQNSLLPYLVKNYPKLGTTEGATQNDHFENNPRNNAIANQAMPITIDDDPDNDANIPQSLRFQSTPQSFLIRDDLEDEVGNTFLNMDTSMDTKCNDTAREVPFTSSVETSMINRAINPELFFHEGGGVKEADISPKNGKPQTVSHVDSKSRQQRKIRILSVIALKKDQTKITDFFTVFKDVQNLVENDSTIKRDVLKCTEQYIRQTSVGSYPEKPALPDNQSLLNILKETAIKNSTMKLHGRKFDQPLKLFTLYIFIIGGRLLYETLYQNMKNSLPSITTINRTLNETGVHIREGMLMFSELKSYLMKRNLPLRVFISEDQTAILSRVKYDPKSNEMVGFVSPLSEDTGFPVTGQYTVDSVSDIERAFKEESLSNNAYVFMAQPLTDKVPAFCLGIFGSNNTFTHKDVLNRWKHIEEEAKKQDIIIEGYSSDGDTRCLKAMKIMSKLLQTDYTQIKTRLKTKGHTKENKLRKRKTVMTKAEDGGQGTSSGINQHTKEQLVNCPYEPYFQVNYNLDRDLDIPVVIQDTVHISTKLKTRLLKEGIVLPMGEKCVSKQHIESVIDNYSKDQHFLCKSLLRSQDKMNFEAVDKLSATCVTDLLKQIPGAEATRQFLLLIRYILDAFLSKDMEILNRVHNLWYSTLFIRGWRYWIILNGHSIQNNCITLNTYTCIELNAHGLLLLIEKCRNRASSEEFAPWLYSSQPCEKIFRQTRSMTSTYSTVVNYGLADILRRLHRIQSINEISNDLSDKFSFPREANKKLGDNKRNYSKFRDIVPTQLEIKNTIELAKNQAITDLNQLGISFVAAGETLGDEETKKRLEEVFGTVFMKSENQSKKEQKNKKNEIATNKNTNVDEDVDELEPDNEDEDQENSTEYGEVELSDPEDIEESQHTPQESMFFSTFDNLSFNDYTQNEWKHSKKASAEVRDEKNRAISDNNTTKPSFSPYLTVRLKNKTVTVRKSSLCWFFSEKTGRLSSDRLLRVKGMTCGDNRKSKRKNEKTELQRDTKTTYNKTKTKINKKANKKPKTSKTSDGEIESEIKELEDDEADDSSLSSKTETDVSSDYRSESETLTESFSDKEDEKEIDKYIIETKIKIEEEKYYSVYYDSGWYIGRVTDVVDSRRSKMKFLESYLDNFSWPKEDDIQDVENGYIIYGPINLLGAHPFQISRKDRAGIQSAFRKYKK